MRLEVITRRCNTSLASAFAVLVSCSIARAQDTSRAAAQQGRPSADHPVGESTPHPVRVGAIGGIGFPRPLAVEGMVLVGGTVALEVEYGALPPTRSAE
jgi:hypothetical protein